MRLAGTGSSLATALAEALDKHARFSGYKDDNHNHNKNPNKTTKL